MLSHVQLFTTPQVVACQALLVTESSRQEYWHGLPVPTPEDLPDPGIQPRLPASPALVGKFFTTEPPGKPVDGRLFQKLIIAILALRV